MAHVSLDTTNFIGYFPRLDEEVSIKCLELFAMQHVIVQLILYLFHVTTHFTHQIKSNKTFHWVFTPVKQ